MTKVKSYQDLDVWKKAMDLVMECYKAVNKFPKTEVYGFKLTTDHRPPTTGVFH